VQILPKQKDIGQRTNMSSLGAPRPKGKILVVDDDLCMREVAALFLGEKGYACTASEKAVLAINLLEREHFDLIITDLHMPEMDGLALTKLVKTSWPETKVMIMTGDTDIGIKNHALQNGVDQYMVKPFSLDQFLCNVDGCLINHHPGLKSYKEVLRSKAASC
jgi:DNA-binding response OmpR family regulator